MICKLDSKHNEFPKGVLMVSGYGKGYLKGFLVAVLVTTLLATPGCSPKAPAEEPGGNEGPEVSITVYFSKTQDGAAEMVPVTRRVTLEEDSAEARLEAAVAALLEGPTGDEKAQGLSSEAEDAAGLISVSISRPYAVLDFSSRLQQMGGSARVSGFLGQLAHTASDIGGVKGVVLKVEGQVMGGDDMPFTGEGVLFESLHRPLDAQWLKTLGPSDILDLFIVVVPDTGLMWELMGPASRMAYKEPGGIDWTAYAEGLGSWRGYKMIEETVEGDRAWVTITGDQTLEGMFEPAARYTAHMVRVDGVWRWDFPAPTEEVSSGDEIVPFTLTPEGARFHTVTEVQGLPNFMASAWLDDNRLLGLSGTSPFVFDASTGQFSSLGVEAWWLKASKDGSQVLFGNGQGLHVVASAGGQPRLLVAKGEAQIGGGLLSPSNKQLLYWYEHEWDNECFIYDMALGDSVPLDTSLDHYFLTAPSGWMDEDHIVFTTRASRRKDGTQEYNFGYRGDILLVNVKTGKKRLLTGAGDDTFYEALAVLKDGRIAMVTRKDKDVSLGVLDLDGKVTTLAGSSGASFYVCSRGDAWAQLTSKGRRDLNEQVSISLSSGGQAPVPWAEAVVGDAFSGILWSPLGERLAVSVHTSVPAGDGSYQAQYSTFVLDER
jgi:hypothetical protein